MRKIKRKITLYVKDEELYQDLLKFKKVLNLSEIACKALKKKVALVKKSKK